MTRTLHIFALLSLAALICGQLGRLHWFAELFSHFVPHYAAIFALAALSLRRRKKTSPAGRGGGVRANAAL